MSTEQPGLAPSSAGGTYVEALPGRRLFARCWQRSAGVPRSAPVVVLHGYGEHSGRYDEVAGALAAQGHDVWALDMWGHGRSGGRRADVGDLAQVLGDIEGLVDMATGGNQARERPAPPAAPRAEAPVAFMAAASPHGDQAHGDQAHGDQAHGDQAHGDQARGERPRGDQARGAPPLMLGHSMGGAFAAAYASQRPGRLGGMALSAPALHVASQPWPVVWAARALATFLPGAGVARIDPQELTRDDFAVRRFVEDPLVWHGRLPVRTALAMYDAGRVALAKAEALTLPVLVLHGEADRIVPSAPVRRYFEALGSTDKTFTSFAGFRHECLHELGRARALAGLLAWARTHGPDPRSELLK